MRQQHIPTLTAFAHTAVRNCLEYFISCCVPEPFVIVDGTCGNGHDTYFLADTVERFGRQVQKNGETAGLHPARRDGTVHPVQAKACAPDKQSGSGTLSQTKKDSEGPFCRLIAFDVQKAALQATRQRLANSSFHRVAIELIPAGHEFLHEYVRPDDTLAAVMYNLGYLPGSDKTCITEADATLASLATASRFLAPAGVLAIHAYGGHPGGMRELEAIEEWCGGLPVEEWLVACYRLCNKVRNQETVFVAQRRG